MSTPTPRPFRVARDLRTHLALLGISLALAACSPFGAINHLSEADHYTRQNGVAYGDAPRQRLDIYRPVQAEADAPIVVFFYGGGWRKGARQDYAFVGSALTEAGMTVVIADYRVYEDVRFPTFVEDGAAAVAWVNRTLRSTAKMRPPLFLMGHSAGAHIAALLALDDRYLREAADGDLSVAGWIGLSGPYDFLPIESGYLLEVFPAATRPMSQPVNFAGPDSPPALLVHGTEDDTVEPGNSRRLADALREHDVDVTLVEQEGRGHAAVVAALAPPLEFAANTLGATLAFIERLSSDPTNR